MEQNTVVNHLRELARSDSRWAREILWANNSQDIHNIAWKLDEEYGVTVPHEVIEEAIDEIDRSFLRDHMVEP